MNHPEPSPEARGPIDGWIDVTAAVLVRSDRVLIARRPKGDRLAGKWEFPGGKVEPGESPRACLERELLEEFGIRAEVCGYLGESRHRYPHAAVRLLVFQVRTCTGTLMPTAHSAHRWVRMGRLPDYDLAPADIPVAARLADGTWSLVGSGA